MHGVTGNLPFNFNHLEPPGHAKPEGNAILVNKKESLISKVNVSFASPAFFACYPPLCESA
jgi:hypothetical protein